ncbi:galactose-specific lectin nattectin-like [Brachionichthys hirsutus]|uniref:galactose-specific lectin nattectin-like n=1 Tax=Brachionichthys hirsutus TaxID=412623 RepID=UPI003604DB11
MASGFYFVVLVCLTSGLWMEANAWKHEKKHEICCPCKSGWMVAGDRCVMFNFKKMSWANAESSCISAGGNLASIHTEEEYTFIRDVVLQATGQNATTWVGGYDAPEDGKWFWSDGKHFNFTYWGKNEPSNKDGKEHCMEINFAGRNHVNDQDCLDKNSFICASRPNSYTDDCV